jgi:dual-specificity kinase
MATKRAREEEAESGKRRKITYDVPNQSKEEGHFHVVLGLDVDADARYKIIAYLGDGTFGKVVLAWDRTLKVFCAVKIVKNIPKYTRDAEYEISYMHRIIRDDPTDKYHCVRLRETFVNDKGHMCLVMSKHGPNLLKCLQRKLFSLKQVAEIGAQLFSHLNFLHTVMKCVHTDLKPENILLDAEVESLGTPDAPCPIRVCDFGGCNDDNKPEGRTSVIQTRHYRAPEVVLKLGWRCSADIWSVGCILFELLTGRLLYDTHENREHLAMMQAHLGAFPSDFPKKVPAEFESWFHRSGKLVWPASDVSAKSIAAVAKQKPLASYITDLPLLDLIIKCLAYDPKSRPTPKEALAHPFFASYFEKETAGGKTP